MRINFLLIPAAVIWVLLLVVLYFGSVFVKNKIPPVSFKMPALPTFFPSPTSSPPPAPAFTSTNFSAETIADGCLTGDTGSPRLVITGDFQIVVASQQLLAGPLQFVPGMPYDQVFYSLNLPSSSSWRVYYFLQYANCGHAEARLIKIHRRDGRLDWVRIQTSSGQDQQRFPLNLDQPQILLDAQNQLRLKIHQTGVGNYQNTLWQWDPVSGDFNQIGEAVYTDN